MTLRPILLIFLGLFSLQIATAQEDIRLALKEHINKLSANQMEGRGYVKKGAEKAGAYIRDRFREMGLRPLGSDGSYVQFYKFGVNTFPDIMQVAVKKKMLEPGRDYLVDARSSGCRLENARVRTVDLSAIADTAAWEKTRASFDKEHIWFLKNTDSFCARFSVRSRSLPGMLPDGVFVIPVKGKMTWTVGTDTLPATVLYVQDSVLPRRVKKMSVNIRSHMQPEYKSANIIAYVPGEVPDSFVVFSAHYDHLGRMGPAVFPGASDNASGTAMLLYQAKYFSKHPQRYSIAFLAFSGEEAGLKGSDYFVKNTPIPLEKIKFVTNVDIMGDATDGITVVNATEYPEQFALLKQLNEQKSYLPEIKSRGKAANSDHYHFSENGVPAIFIYTNGGKGYYHDIFDKASEVSLKNVPAIAQLLIDFTLHLNKK